MPGIRFSKIAGSRFSPVLLVMILFLIISFATRLVLLVYAGTHSEINIFQGIGLFFIGGIYDISITAFIVLPLVIFLWFQNNFIYRKKIIPWIAGGFLLLLGILIFTNIIPRDYNRDVHKAIVILVATRFAIYLLLAILPYRFLIGWRRLMLNLFFTSVVFLLLLNAVSEWFFWQEFSARYNFIAVDYLIYTNEVIGNIIESYHIYLILSAIMIASAGIWYFCRPVLSKSVVAPMHFQARSYHTLLLLLVAAAAYFFVPEKWRHFSKNEYANELAGNGLYQFAMAYTQNELSFYKFYQTLPDTEAFNTVRKELQSPNATFTTNNVYNIERNITDSLPEQQRNVVLISVEKFECRFYAGIWQPAAAYTLP